MHTELNKTSFLTLADKRKLAYVEYGDPHGASLFYFHGWPSCRLSGRRLDQLAKKLGIRVICPDRPGLGRSDPKVDRDLKDWTDDVLALARHLKIRKFTVLGVSGGGPYAYACAYFIPKYLTGVDVVAGLGPVYEKGLIGKMNWGVKSAVWSARKAPSLLAIATWLLWMGAKYLPAGVSVFRFTAHSKSDRKMLKIVENQKIINIEIREALQQGIRNGIYDWRVYASPWGFDVKDIRVPVRMWHGTEDKSVPCWTATYIKSQLTQSSLYTFVGSGHYLMYFHRDEILSKIAKDLATSVKI